MDRTAEWDARFAEAAARGASGRELTQIVLAEWAEQDAMRAIEAVWDFQRPLALVEVSRV